jgi:CheY-like chemotaxis protein
MPHLDGLGLCRAVRALPTPALLPVILWSSAEADDPRFLEAIELGGVEFLSKSLAITEIDAALRRILAADDTSRMQPVAEAGEALSSQALAALSNAAAA